jgi:hypothetical protein
VPKLVTLPNFVRKADFLLLPAPHPDQPAALAEDFQSVPNDDFRDKSGRKKPFSRMTKFSVGMATSLLFLALPSSS